MKFATFDRDQDNFSNHCAVKYHGAWWYKDCHHSNLNGLYVNGAQRTAVNLCWWYWRNTCSVSMKATEMKVRPSLLTCPL